MKKGQSPLFTGIILCLAGVYLAVYFSLNGMWNAGTVIAMFLIAGLAAFQFVIYFKFFKVDMDNKKKKKRR
ncbi:MAG: hypothetical protein J1F60_05400 [Oscillospiraceae bacterium]|nr:hypothetical protein [Oscillospiraceae bacterium]